MTSKWGMGAVVGALVIAFGLAGCTAGTPTAEPTKTAAPVVTPTPTPTPTSLATIAPLPPSKPTLDQLEVSPDGLGDLVIGKPVPSESATTSSVKFLQNMCVGEPVDPLSGWIAAYPNRPFSLTTVGQTKTGAINLIFVSSPRITTYNGIRIGSTLAQLTAAYGKPDRIVQAAASNLYVVNGDHGELVFDVSKQVTYGPKKTPYWTAAEVNRVQLIYVRPAGSTPVSSVGIDAPGGCA